MKRKREATRKHESRRTIVVVAIVLAVWITASTMDYSDAVRAAQPTAEASK